MFRALWEQAFSPTMPPWWAVPLWLLIGNADDGPYGRYAAQHMTEDRFLPIDWKAAWQWWLRNPAHNLFCRALAIPYTKQRVVFGTPAAAPGAKMFWPVDGGVLVLLNGGPFISFRNASVELYAGFRPRPGNGSPYGALGFTIRKRD